MSNNDWDDGFIDMITPLTVAELTAIWRDAGYDMALAYERAKETQCFFTGQGDTAWPAFDRAEEAFTAAANRLATFKAEA